MTDVLESGPTVMHKMMKMNLPILVCAGKLEN